MKRLIFLTIVLFFGATTMAQSQTTATAAVSTTFRWEAMNGPLQGNIFLAGEDDSEAVLYSFQLKNFGNQSFNAKVWKDGSSIPWLAIVTISFDDNHRTIIDDQSFRFDQATQERKERFYIVNRSSEPLYFRIDNKELMLNPGERSYKLEAYMGWYYIEMSRKTSAGEVVPLNVVISVANRQREVKVDNEDIK